MGETSLIHWLDNEMPNAFDEKRLAQYFQRKSLEKGTYIVRKDEVCRNLAFLESGMALYYKIDDEGQEIICDFAREGDWVTQYESFINQRVSPLSIRIIETAEVQLTTRQKLLQLYKEVPVFESYARKIIEKLFFSSLARNNELQILTAEERYLKFANANPDLIQRIPQYYIASYLGIAPQSLSRIRKKIMR